MRVAVHHPARTEPDGTAVEASVSAFRLGRITDLVDPITGETTPADEVAAKLLAAAKKEFPDCEVELQRLIVSIDDDLGSTSEWVHEDSVPEGAVSPGGGVIATKDLATEQSQEAS